MHMYSCMRAYATVQRILCHESCCELILSLRLARASCRLSFAACSCCLSCCLDQTRRPTLFAREIRPNPRWLMTQLLLWYYTSIIQSSALVQSLSSLSMGRTRAWQQTSCPTKFSFRHGFRGLFSLTTFYMGRGYLAFVSSTAISCKLVLSLAEMNSGKTLIQFWYANSRTNWVLHLKIHHIEYTCFVYCSYELLLHDVVTILL